MHNLQKKNKLKLNQMIRLNSIVQNVRDKDLVRKIVQKNSRPDIFNEDELKE